MASNTEHINEKVTVGNFWENNWVQISADVVYTKVKEDYAGNPVYSVTVDDKEIGQIARTEKKWSSHTRSGKIRLNDYSKTAWRIVGDKFTRLPYETRYSAAVELLKRNLEGDK